MKMDKKCLVLGMVIGLMLAFFYFHFFAPRYEIQKSGISTIKLDKWTGQSWRLVDDDWKQMLDRDQNLEQIDRTLQQALKISIAKVDTTSALKRLRDSYPVLKDVSDDELLERIKQVYSKQVLVNMYLGDFLKANEGTPAP